MSYSALVEYVRISPNSTNPRQGKITDIAIHHMACNLTVEECGRGFSNPARQASSNYGIGTDGRVACYVEEENRSWCTSNADLDHRAITIEVANCSGDPDWKVSDQALESTIALCVDVCRRYGFRLNYTGDKSGNLHMHKWYAPTGCPGPYLGGKFPYIAAEVNRRLDAEQGTENKPVEVPSVSESGEIIYRVQVGAFEVKANAERQLAIVKALGYDDAFIAEVDDKLYRVQVGAFRVKANAEKLLQELLALGVKGFVTTLSGKPVLQNKTVDELALEVIAGQHGDGEARKKSLGAMYDAVQNRVNELMD